MPTKPSRFKKPTKPTTNTAEEKNLRQTDLTKKYAEESQATINQNFDQRKTKIEKTKQNLQTRQFENQNQSESKRKTAETIAKKITKLKK